MEYQVVRQPIDLFREYCEPCNIVHERRCRFNYIVWATWLEIWETEPDMGYG